MNKKPAELHVVDGTKPKGKSLTLLPDSMRERIPCAEWMDNPDAWDKEKFVAETAQFLFDVYGIGSNQDKHILSMLAEQIELYIQCTKHIRPDNLIVEYNNGSTPGANPMISVRNKTITLIVQLMNELGLTPRGRLTTNKKQDESPISQLMRGPKS